MSVRVIHGDALEAMRALAAEGTRVEAIVTDPPAGIGFMNRSWDGDLGGREQWVAWMTEIAAAALRCIKPGGHALVWSLPRTSHWTAWAWETAGWSPRDRLAHIFGSGFPKSLDVSKALDKMAGAEREVVGAKRKLDAGFHRVSGGGRAQPEFYRTHEVPVTAPATEAARQWQGWGTHLKPAIEDWWLFRAPLADVSSAVLWEITGWSHWHSSRSDGDDEIVTGKALHPGARSFRVRLDKDGQEIAREDLGPYEPFTTDAIAAQVLAHGTGALNVDGCRVATDCARPLRVSDRRLERNTYSPWPSGSKAAGETTAGRWPANVVHDGSDEVLAAFAAFGTSTTGRRSDRSRNAVVSGTNWGTENDQSVEYPDDGGGSPARFFPALGWEKEEKQAIADAQDASSCYNDGPTGEPSCNDPASAAEESSSRSPATVSEDSGGSVAVNADGPPNESRKASGTHRARRTNADAGIGSGEKKAVGKRTNSLSTDGCGSAKTGLFHPATMSITSTTTIQTTGSATSSLSPRPSTTPTISGAERGIEANQMGPLFANASGADCGSPSPTSPSGGQGPITATASHASPAISENGKGDAGQRTGPSRRRRSAPALPFSEDELRFMYHPKASRKERGGSRHPTVKPVKLLQWLCRLVTPPGGTVLDPFAGSGTTGEAAMLEGFNAILIEREAEYVTDAARRLERARLPLMPEPTA